MFLRVPLFRKKDALAMPVFEHEARYDCSPVGLFDFLTRPENIVKVSNPDLGIRFEAPPEQLSQGDILNFQIVTFGKVNQITHRIVEFRDAELLIEEQIEGPLAAWRHVHEYVAIDDGCLKRDVVEFEPPGGLIGFLLTPDKILDQLEDGMYIREQRLNEFISEGLIS